MPNDFNMGIGNAYIGRSEARFMRQTRWTIEFDWLPPSSARDIYRGIEYRINNGRAIINGAKSIIDTTRGRDAPDRPRTPAQRAADLAQGITETTRNLEGMIRGPIDKDEGLSAYLCHVAKRPSISFDRVELYYHHDTYFMPGRPTYEPINITLYDVAGNSEVARWLMRVYSYGKPLRAPTGVMQEMPKVKCMGFLTMFDGEGQALQSWIMHGCWPTSVDFGPLEYGSSDLANVEVSMSFDNMELSYDYEDPRRGNLATKDPGNFSSQDKDSLLEKAIKIAKGGLVS